MCQGHSSRSSYGGAVARIHPAGGTKSFSCHLQFQNGAGHSDPTTVSYRLERPQPCKLRIHQFGDLSLSLASAGRILHSVDLFPITSSGLTAENTTGSVVLDRRLDLGVGEEGIIGRVISVVVGGGSESENTLLGEGVIGWN